MDSIQFQSSNIFSNVVADNYIITVKDATSNIRKITLNIPTFAKLTLTTSNKIDSDCGFSNGSILLSPSNGTAPFQYSQDGLSYQNSNSFNGLPASTINFFVRDSGGCIDSKTITIGTKSKLKIFAGRDTGIFINQTLSLFAKDLTNSNFISFKWTPTDGLDNAFIQNPTATITKNMEYTVEATNAAGCSVKDTIHIDVYKDIDIFVPTAFTPNSDYKNDFLKPIPRGIKQLNYFKIYNRYGNVVFSSTNFNNGWDGKYNGELQNTGSYIWISEGIDIKGHMIFRKGIFTLLR